MQKSEQEELQEQVEIETEQQGVPAVEDDELGVIERQLPPQCHPEPNTDFGGVAVRWGLTYHVNSAAECCKACLWHAAYARVGQLKCNVWVFCPEKNGCPSPDGYDHKFGECWLKQANQPQATVQNYSLVMRNKNSSPLPVLWISGVTNSNGGWYYDGTYYYCYVGFFFLFLGLHPFSNRFGPIYGQECIIVDRSEFVSWWYWNDAKTSLGSANYCIWKAN